ncbi:MAG: von Willebrand factor type A domain-containing protein [Bacteroidales bacterium]|nr:von Willebrand factor type A domain-containing protein [Bacteroidales bacterium]
MILIISADAGRLISGLVTDDQGSPLSGVSVIAKGSNRNTLTDLRGKYQLEVFPEDKILVFSHTGYQRKEILLGKQSLINVSLSQAIEMSDESLATDRIETIQPKSAGSAVYRDKKEYSGYEARPSPVYNMNNQNWNTEGYSAIHENGYKDVLTAPLSTFSIDVDKASYANVRRYINMGQLPPVDAVRIEELINYFNYDYPEARGEHPFSVSTELSVCPWNTSHQLLHVGLKGKSVDKTELPASNLVFLLDVSGSMSDPNKLPLLKNAFQLLVKELRPQDKVAIVVYAGAAGIVLNSTSGNHKETILSALDKLQAGGSTAGGEGLLLAYKTASENFISGGNNRIILATDGDFNIGVSSNAEMERLIEKERDKGIFITVLGFGMGNYKDDKMEIIADKGNGNYAYIDNLQEARKVLVSEFGGTLFTIAKDVKFQLEFNPRRVKAYRLIGYENRMLNAEDFNNDKKDAGEMGSGHTVTALYEIVPAGSDEHFNKIDPLKYQENPAKVCSSESDELLTIKLRYKKPDGNSSILYEKPVRGEVLDISNTSDNFRFSAAVAEFGLVLRNSEFKAGATMEQLIRLAQGSRGKDEEGYRGEFIKLANTAKELNDMRAEK